MITFLKANVASLAASISDFFMTMLLVQLFKVNVVMAAATGTVTGGIVNFLIGRHWVFRAGGTRRTQERGTQNEMKPDKLYFAFGVKRLAFSVTTVRQLWKYALVWTGNLILNTGGVYVFACQAGLHYTLSKVVTSLTVAFLYNYPLQKNFVFSNNW
jgi:putative flippase GtrA